MEGSKNGVDEWDDTVMTSNGLIPGFESESCLVKPISTGFNQNEGVLEDNHENVENFKLDMDKKTESGELGSGVLNVGGDMDSLRTGESIAERRGVKFGFDGPKICTMRFRCSSPLPSPGAQSPRYLTIPSGISPAALLDSPILLPNSQHSPTTGTFSSSTVDGDGQMFVSVSSVETSNGFDGGPCSTFKLNLDPVPTSCFQGLDKQAFATHFDNQSLKSLHQPVDFEFPVQLHGEVAMNHHDTGSPPVVDAPENVAINDSAPLMQQSLANNVVSVQMEYKNDPSQEEDSGTPNSFDEDHKGKYSSAGTVRTTEDGYNWRKYGQKQVKGSEYPRSYYKCTNPNCLVKKKVERSHDGQITEIIYKGAHNHPKPQPCQKSAFGAASPFNESSDANDGSGTCVKPEGGSIWRNMQNGLKDVKFGSEWRGDGLEITSSTSAVTEVSDPLSTTDGKAMGMIDSVGTPEFSSTLVSYEDDEEDAATEGSFSLGDDNNDCEPDSKKRKKESYFFEPSMGPRAVREPRVVVQIESEIDVLDDGYRWRKYGQKVVKGNPNPRSYYKCTSAGCTVKKHVERASHNLKFVITTYEGKHNHEVPTSRNSSHANSGSGTLPLSTNVQSSLPLPRSPHLPKPEIFRQDLPLHFDTKIEGNTDFLRPNFLGNLDGGISSYYPLKFPTLPNARPYAPFGLGNHHVPYPNTTGVLPPMPDMSISFPLRLPRSSNLAINPGRPFSSVQTPFVRPQSEENKVKLLKPKQEQGDESFHDTDIEHTYTSSSLDYNCVLPTFPS